MRIVLNRMMHIQYTVYNVRISTLLFVCTNVRMIALSSAVRDAHHRTTTIVTIVYL